MRITNVQKKSLSDIFAKFNLNKMDFETSGDNSEFNVKYKHDYFAFKIKQKAINSYQLLISSVDNTDEQNKQGTWQEVTAEFNKWTVHLKRELDTLTGWKNIREQNYLKPNISDLDSDFTTQEKIELKAKIEGLRTKLNLINIDTDKIKTIDHKLNELSEKLDSSNKFDWKSLFVGTVFSLIMTLSIPPEAAGTLWELIKDSFSNLTLLNK